jgi:integrase
VQQRRQNGCITRRGGWWVLRYRQQVFVNGKVKTVMRSVRLAPVDAKHKTKASVRALAAEILAPLNRTSVSPLRVMTVGDFVEDVYLPFAEQQKRQSTYRGYEQIWDDYLKGTSASAWMREVKTYDVQAWLEGIARQPHVKNEQEYTLSKTTLKHVKHFLSGVFQHAAQQGYFDGANPVRLAEIPAFAPPGQEGRAYSLEEIGQMVKVLPELAATVVETAAYTGLRLGELRGARWEYYEPPQDEESLGLLHVMNSVWRSHVGNPKTERSKAPVPVIRQLADRLRAHWIACRRPATGPIFANSLGKPLDLDALYRRQMKDVLKKAGVEWVGWHGFRRGLASNLNRLGVDDSVIQAILRHSDVSVTQRCYIKTVPPDAVAAMRQLSARVSELKKQSDDADAVICQKNDSGRNVVQ